MNKSVRFFLAILVVVTIASFGFGQTAWAAPLSASGTVPSLNPWGAVPPDGYTAIIVLKNPDNYTPPPLGLRHLQPPAKITLSPTPPAGTKYKVCVALPPKTIGVIYRWSAGGWAKLSSWLIKGSPTVACAHSKSGTFSILGRSAR
jgi:hypothetical protein